MQYPPPIPGLLMGALVVAVVCAMECWIFVFMYRKVRKSVEGRHLYRLSVALGLTFSLTVLFQFLPHKVEVLIAAAIIQLLVFLFIAAELWVRIMLLVENQRVAREKAKTQVETEHTHYEARDK